MLTLAGARLTGALCFEASLSAGRVLANGPVLDDDEGFALVIFRAAIHGRKYETLAGPDRSESLASLAAGRVPQRSPVAK